MTPEPDPDPDPDPEPTHTIRFLSSANTPLDSVVAYDTMEYDGENYHVNVKYYDSDDSQYFTTTGVFLISGSGATNSPIGFGKRGSASHKISKWLGNVAHTGDYTSLGVPPYVLKDSNGNTVELDLDLGGTTAYDITWS